MALLNVPEGRTIWSTVQWRSSSLPAAKTKQLATPNNDRTLQVAGRNTILPIHYGRVSVPGIIGPVGTNGSGELVIGVIWGLGLCEEIETVYVNDDATLGATRTDYLGYDYQPIDPDLADAITAYGDDLVLDTPNGRIGVCYSVFRFAADDIGGAPRFQAVIKGRRMDWLENQGADDALYADTQLSAVFNSYSFVDESSRARPWIMATSVEIADGYAKNTGTAAGITFGGDDDFGTSDFCIETKVDVSFPGTAFSFFDIYRHGQSLIFRLNDDAVSVAVADGTPGNYAIDANIYTLPQPGEYDIKLIRRSGTFYLYVDGVEEWSSSTAADIPVDSLAGIRTCYSESSPANVNRIRCLRVTIGSDRYTGEHHAFSAPFSDGARYSDNPAVCFADLARNPIYGIGSGVSGLPAAEAWCDDVVDGSARAAIGLSLTRPESAYDLLDLLAGYAQCLWYHEGSDIVIVPDAPVEEGDRYTETAWLAGSLSVSSLDDQSAPTRVYVRYTQPESSTGIWGDAVTYAELPGVESGDVPLRETTLFLPGIYSIGVAQLAAQAKVARLAGRVQVSWVSTDIGVQYRPGDVIELSDANYGISITVKVTAVEMVDHGRHRITGMRYDDSHYPSSIELPPSVGTVPVGVIVINGGETVPSGWEAWDTADGKHIIGAGGAYSIGDTGGSSTFAGWAGNTSSVDSHGSSPYSTVIGTIRNPGSDAFSSTLYPDDPPDLTHAHSYTTGSITPAPLTRDVKLIQKTGASASEFPAQARVFGVAGITAPNVSRITAAAGRLIAAAAEAGDRGAASVYVSFATGSYDDTHDHSAGADGFVDQVDPSSIPESFRLLHVDAGGPHTHNFSLLLHRNVKRRRLALYGGSDDFAVVPGIIVLWAGGSVPSGWTLCDGSSGTPDLRDYFIEIAGLGNEGTAEGDNTLSITGSGGAVGHDHVGGPDGTNNHPADGYAHDNTITHTHEITRSSSWMPPYYALAAIMYTG